MSTEYSQQPMLNVILHGAFTFIEDKRANQIQVLVPKIEHHVYRAGNWLGETDLKPGTYQLRGVRAGDGEFDAGRNLIVWFDSTKTRPMPFARLILPRPKRVSSLHTVGTTRNRFSDADDLVEKGDVLRLSALQILSYDFDDEAELRLEADGGEGHYWEPVATNHAVNLHIFSSEDHFGQSHQVDDFELCAELLGSKVRLKNGYGSSGPCTEDFLPPGVSREETEPLPSRTLRMARLGRIVAENSSASHAWKSDAALDSVEPDAGPSLVGSLAEARRRESAVDPNPMVCDPLVWSTDAWKEDSALEGGNPGTCPPIIGWPLSRASTANAWKEDGALEGGNPGTCPPIIGWPLSRASAADAWKEDGALEGGNPGTCPPIIGWPLPGLGLRSRNDHE